jgi:hypothetical protein
VRHLAAYPGAVPSTPPAPSSADRRGDRLVTAGGVTFLAGLVALGVALVLWARTGNAPGVLASLALLCPVGFGVAFAGLVVQVRGRRPRRGADQV